MLVVRNDSIGDYLLYWPWLRRLSIEVQRCGQHLTLLASELWAFRAARFTTDLAYRACVLRQVGARGFGEVIYSPARARSGCGKLHSLYAGAGAGS